MQHFLEQAANRCWYQSSWLGYALWPFSALFAWVVWLRHGAYRSGLLATYRPRQKTIVIGNVTVGGTGKTPLVIALVQHLQQQAIPVVVISRGYGRLNRDLQQVNARSTPSQCGDEPLLIFHATHAPVVVSADRKAAVQYCEHHFPHHVVICDDGLQHYALQRDIEIAVIDGQRRFGNGLLLPGGPLREPLTRLRTVDFRIVNGEPFADADYAMRLLPTKLTHLNSGRHWPLHDLPKHKPWLAVTAIGNPQRFFATLRSLNLTVTEKAFPDHYLFQKNDLLAYASYNIVVTSKDAVKLKAFAFDNVYVLEVTALLPLAFYQGFLQRLQAI